MVDQYGMRWFAAVFVLPLGACHGHQPTAKCSRFFEGMRAAFVRYDANDDGRISRQEYRDVINHVSGGPRDDDPERTGRDFDSLDPNRDGYLTFDEFAGDECKHDRPERS
jgi:Ca2+-binding EF-hand superfamily protein